MVDPGGAIQYSQVNLGGDLAVGQDKVDQEGHT